MVADASPVVGFRRGKRGTLVSTYRSVRDFSKGLVAVRVLGPAPGDFFVDRALNKCVVSDAHAIGADLAARLRSIASPKKVDFDLQFSLPEKITLDELKLLVTSAIGSSKSAAEYWEETSGGLETLFARIQQAKTFDELSGLLRH